MTQSSHAHHAQECPFSRKRTVLVLTAAYDPGGKARPDPQTLAQGLRESNAPSPRPLPGLRRIGVVGGAVTLRVDVDRRRLSVWEFHRDKRRYIDGTFLSSRHSLELGILLDRQRAMINIALNNSGAI